MAARRRVGTHLWILTPHPYLMTRSGPPLLALRSKITELGGDRFRQQGHSARCRLIRVVTGLMAVAQYDRKHARAPDRWGGSFLARRSARGRCRASRRGSHRARARHRVPFAAFLLIRCIRNIGLLPTRRRQRALRRCLRRFAAAGSRSFLFWSERSSRRAAKIHPTLQPSDGLSPVA